MSFDLTRVWKLNSQEGQNEEGGVNAHANCAPSCHLYALMPVPSVDGHTYGDPLEPQDVTNALFPGGWAPNGMTFEAVVAYIQSRTDLFPNLPPITVARPDPLLDHLEASGVSGNPQVIAVCVANATVRPVAAGSPNSTGHAEIVVAHMGGAWTLWNPWWDDYDVLSDDQLLATYIGGVTTFFRSVVPPPPIPVQEEEPMAVALPPLTTVAPGQVVPFNVYSGMLPDRNGQDQPWTTFFNIDGELVDGSGQAVVEVTYTPQDGSGAILLDSFVAATPNAPLGSYCLPSCLAGSKQLGGRPVTGSGILKFTGKTGTVRVGAVREGFRTGW